MNKRQSQMRGLLQSPTWSELEELKKELVDKIAYDSKLRDTEWETLKATVFDAGQIAGINRLFQEIFNTQLTDKND